MFKVTRAVYNALREEAERVGGVGDGTWFLLDGCKTGNCIWGIAYSAGLLPKLDRPEIDLWGEQPDQKECPVLPFSYADSDAAVASVRRKHRLAGESMLRRVSFDEWAKEIGLEVE